MIGIVGGLGPNAHLELERRLLANVERPSADSTYPEWILSSPQTPDRTVALRGGALARALAAAQPRELRVR